MTLFCKAVSYTVSEYYAVEVPSEVEDLGEGAVEDFLDSVNPNLEQLFATVTGDQGEVTSWEQWEDSGLPDHARARETFPAEWETNSFFVRELTWVDDHSSKRPAQLAFAKSWLEDNADEFVDNDPDASDSLFAEANELLTTLRSTNK